MLSKKNTRISPERDDIREFHLAEVKELSFFTSEPKNNTCQLTIDSELILSLQQIPLAAEVDFHTCASSDHSSPEI